MHGCDEFVDYGDLILSSLTREISSTSGKKCGEHTGEVAFSGQPLMGIPPIDGHIRVADNSEGEELDCRSSTDFTTASCYDIDRMAVETND